VYLSASLRGRGRDATAARKRGASGAPSSAPRIIETALKRSERVGTMPAASISTGPRTRSGARSASSAATHPPSELPATTTSSSPRWSQKRSIVRA